MEEEFDLTKIENIKEVDLTSVLKTFNKGVKITNKIIEVAEDAVLKNCNALFQIVSSQFEDFEKAYNEGYNRNLKIKFLKIFITTTKIRDTLYGLTESEDVGYLLESVEDFLDYLDEYYPDMKKETFSFVNELDKNGKEV